MNDKSYISWISMSDAALLSSMGEFVRHHRLLQSKTQGEVAADAGISRSTLSLLERGETVTLATFIQVLRVLDLLHVMESFKIEKQVSPIELAEMDKKKRYRASKQNKTHDTKSDW